MRIDRTDNAIILPLCPPVAGNEFRNYNDPIICLARRNGYFAISIISFQPSLIHIFHARIVPLLGVIVALDNRDPARALAHARVRCTYLDRNVCFDRRGRAITDKYHAIDSIPKRKIPIPLKRISIVRSLMEKVHDTTDRKNEKEKAIDLANRSIFSATFSRIRDLVGSKGTRNIERVRVRRCAVATTDRISLKHERIDYV